MQNIIQETDDFILNLFKEKLPNTFVYHNYTHSKRVLKSINEIIENSQIGVKDATVLQLAALLHDTGYIEKREGHEEESVRIAREFLESKKVEKEIVDGVEKCILATRFKKYTPKDELEEIIRDADSSHFGKDYFEEASELLRQELLTQNVHNYSPEEWLEENIRVLIEKHQYYSDFAITNWQPVKLENLTMLIKKHSKEGEKVKKEKLKAQFKADAKIDNPERGIQTFFRVALRNHIKLSDIADTKANILLSVNAIIISLILANLLSKFDSAGNQHLILPTGIFVLFSAITMILSVVATRPNVTQGQFTKEDVKNKNVNLAFFGNFHKMEFSEFEWAVNELLKDRHYVYKSLTKDLYYLGKVLDRKYRILRLAYTIFVAGTIISIIAFALAIGFRSVP